MTELTRYSKFIFPVSIGLGIAWTGISLLKSENALLKRRMELELQINAKSIKGI
tara:strand:+ start:301 stop:462 length:162 start_codon:yes stop_codon:yes gene_type:complete